jgi:hypothetical protein
MLREERKATAERRIPATTPNATDLIRNRVAFMGASVTLYSNAAKLHSHSVPFT